MKQLTKEEAIKIYESGIWKDWSDEDLVAFQLFQEKLCVPFDIFHKAIEKVLGRPVFTHEFGLNYDGLVAEYPGRAPKPSLEDIVNLIPEEKRIVIFTQRNNTQGTKERTKSTI